MGGSISLADTSQITASTTSTGTPGAEVDLGGQRTNTDVFEGAQPDGTAGDTDDDVYVHNMRYDTGQGEETPDATVQRITNGSLDTSGADQTEETRAAADVPWNAPQGAPTRGIWRTIPVGENVTIRVTDQSSGSGNVLAFDTVVYEGELLPD